MLLCIVLDTDFTRQENNLHLLIGTTIVIDQLLWELKGVKQDLPVSKTSTQEKGTHIIKVDKDFPYILILVGKFFRHKNCTNNCAYCSYLLKEDV